MGEFILRLKLELKKKKMNFKLWTNILHGYKLYMLEKFSFDVKRLESRRSAAAGASRCDLSLPFLSKWTVGMATHDSSSQPNLCSIPNRDIFYFCIWEMKKTREKKNE